MVFGSTALAHEEHIAIVEEVIVYGRAEEQLGIAAAASSGQIADADIQLKPRLRIGELVEAVPGMVATQHSGTGKANQYFLRGFNLDHGTDFSAHANGVPLNMRTHGHGQGYLDLNFLIPEMVSRTGFRKGPYHAAVGDFSSAGSAEFSFYDKLSNPMLSATIGENDYLRTLAAGSVDVASGTFTGALDLTRNNGPWKQSEDLEQNKFHLRYSTPLNGAEAHIDLQAYQSEWDATDQIPLRALQSGLVDVLGGLDPDLGGQTKRYALTATLDFSQWTASAYAVDYDFDLYSNFTYFLDDPLNGDEFAQSDKRRMYGLNVEGELATTLNGLSADITWGVQTRIDDIDTLGLYRTQARVMRELVRKDAVTERSIGTYGAIEFHLTEHLRTIAGLRADFYDWRVDAQNALNGGQGQDHLFSPKLSIAYRFHEQVEGYANWGRGFHSNDVRGATISVDPESGDSLQPVSGLAASEGAELGIRIEHDKRFNASLVIFWLQLNSELVFVGDAGGTEVNPGTRRTGVEASSFWQITDRLAMDANYTYTSAAFNRRQGGGKDIPGAVESTASLGFNAVWKNGFSANIRARYLGPAPLVEDGSIRADDSFLVNAGLGFRSNEFEWRLEIFNALDSNDHDISYYYASRLPGEVSQGVEDVHLHPLEPRSVRATMIWYPASQR